RRFFTAAAAAAGGYTLSLHDALPILREDVQSLLRRITIQPDETLSKRFPAEMPCRIQIILKDGRMLSSEKQDYEGFYTRPLSWEDRKSTRLNSSHSQISYAVFCLKKK